MKNTFEYKPQTITRKNIEKMLKREAVWKEVQGWLVMICAIGGFVIIAVYLIMSLYEMIVQ